jgi:hypothetical protein
MSKRLAPSESNEELANRNRSPRQEADMSDANYDGSPGSAVAFGGRLNG